MTDNTELNILELDGQQYFLVDSIQDNQINYHYFSNLKNRDEVKVLKDKKEDEEEFFVSLDTETELDYALSLFYQKHQQEKF